MDALLDTITVVMADAASSERGNFDYHNKLLTLTPLSKNSISNYIDQLNRIKNGELHLWNDSKIGNSKKGDLFGYVVNKQKGKDGKIIIYKILEVLPPQYSLEYWTNRTRNVVILSNNYIYEGDISILFKILGYNDKYKQQNTMKIHDKHHDKLQEYLKLIFN